MEMLSCQSNFKCLFEHNDSSISSIDLQTVLMNESYVKISFSPNSGKSVTNNEDTKMLRCNNDKQWLQSNFLIDYHNKKFHPMEIEYKMQIL